MLRILSCFVLLSFVFFTSCEKDGPVNDPVTYGENHFEDTVFNPHKGPMYWSCYEYNFTTDGYIPEEEWSKNVDWVDQNLKDYGYKMVCIDGWGDDSKFNQDGYRTTHSSQWQHDYAWWSHELQSRGMTLGMYNNPLWVIKTAADAGVKIKGTNIPLKSIMNEGENALWFKWVQVDKPGAEEYVKGYIQYYADMGIRYLRVDFLSWFEDGQDRYLGKTGPERKKEYYSTALRWMREACDKNGMMLSLVMPNLYNEGKVERQYGHMIRINEDAGEGSWWRWSDNTRGVRREGWSPYANAVDGMTYWSYVAGRNKMILDPDFLRINTFANVEEKKSAISLCFISGGAVTVADRYNSIGDDLWLYQNAELIALREDGFVGKPLTNDPAKDKSQIWIGQLKNGDWVVALLNRESDSRTRSISFSEIKINGEAAVRDIWTHKDLGKMSSFSTDIPAHGVIVIKITK